MFKDFDINTIHNIDKALAWIKNLLNLLEIQQKQTNDLKEENQALRDEINRLKGEQGRPDIKPNKKEKSKNTNYSSEKERKKKKKSKKRSKVKNIQIHKEEIRKIDRESLPEDASFKGYKDVVVQDIKLESFNIKFRKEVYYSPSQKKCFMADLPAGYHGEFGPSLKTLAVSLYFDTNVSEGKILALFEDIGISISKGHLSNLLIKNQDIFHQEKHDLFEAGIGSTPWQNIDDTGTRVDGQNWYCQIICNHLYTSYYTTEDKSRLSVLKALTNSYDLYYILNADTFGLLDVFRLSKKVVLRLKQLPQNQKMSEEEFLAILKQHMPDLGPLQKNRILDAAAIAAYRYQTKIAIPHVLAADDAPQFKQITKELALCWVHDGRHYKKLFPYFIYHQDLVNDFLTKYWDYYHELLNFKKHPNKEDAQNLENRFDELFSTKTGYDLLDDRIGKTKQKKENLLLVLKYPNIPLHNNPAELGARSRVRKRDVSYGARSPDGIKAWDTFMSLAATSKKLEQSFFHYIRDRISGDFALPSLAEMVCLKSALS